MSISLKTRCPKEALRLSKALEYHAVMVINHPQVQELDYAQVKEILRSHFTEVLERVKRTIDKDGALTDEQVSGLKDQQALMQEAISKKYDEPYEWLRMQDVIPEDLSLDKMIQPIAERYDIPAGTNDKAYNTLRTEYKHAFNGYLASLLAYNDNAGFYDLTDSSQTRTRKTTVKRTNLILGNVIEAYLKEIKGTINERSFRDQRDCISYLIEVVGEDCLISDIGDDLARKIKQMLQETPTNRSKLEETRGLSLKQQIQAGKTHNLKSFSPSNANKYLQYMGALCKWAIKDKRISQNPFEGVRIKDNNTEPKRVNFSKSEVRTILSALSEIDTAKAVNKTRYWGVLLAVYTGARLDEIASLTIEDVICDDDTGIGYLNITNEEATKSVKSRAGKRIVPIHSQLIELGFFDYIAHAKQVIAKRPRTGDHPTRLLYNLTYTSNRWGRKIGSWFDGTFLPSLGLKTPQKVLHSLRHSFITGLSVADAKLEYIQSIAGHEQGTVTLKTYTHFGTDHLPVLRKCIDKLQY